jgi:hypothetical protein
MFLETKHFYYQYDLDAVTFKYGRLGDPQGHWIQGKYGLQTTGSSITVDRFFTSGNPFGPVKVGDVIQFFLPPDTNYIRKVATKPSNIQITVDTAVDLGVTGLGWQFWPFRIGATNADGWHPVHHDAQLSVFVNWATKASDGLDISISGLGPHNTPLALVAKSYLSAGTDEIPITTPVTALRVGVKAANAFSGTDSISIWLTQRLPRRY